MTCRKCASPFSVHTGNLFLWETIDPEDGEPMTMTRIFMRETCQTHLQEAQQDGINMVTSEFALCHVAALEDWITDQDSTVVFEALCEMRDELFAEEEVLYQSIRLGA